MASDYLLQIVRRDGGIVKTFPPGGVAERDLVEELVSRVQAKGVGVLRGSTHVAGDVRAALDELIYDLKASITP